MATVKVVELISKAKTLLQDTTSVRWPLTELQTWLNDSYREITIIRPDANTQTGEFVCVAGARQDLMTTFPSALRLVDVVRNTAVTSTKGAVRLINRRMLDDQRRTWYADTPSVSIDHYMFDPRIPKEFLVYPPATVDSRLEVVYSSVPTSHALTEAQLGNSATTETIRIDDSFANVMLDYMLYRAYSKDAEYANNAARAVAHYQAVQAALSTKGQVEAAMQPGAA
ncbi:MAG: DUF6682 family protein [Schleiferiaceae bacterium]